MTKEQYEKELELRWKEFWDAIVINAIDNNYWKSIFQNAFETGFNRGFAYANDKPYSDAVFEDAVFEHRNLSQDSVNCDNHIVQDHELVEHIAEARNMLRLQAAAHVASGIIAGDGDYFYYYLPGSKQYLPNSISRKYPEEVARVAFIFADALIAESQKGGAE